MKIVVIGAGQVGSTVVEALHDEHDITVIDLDEERLSALAERFDAGVLSGNGASRRDLEEAGVREAGLLIACTSRDEINIIAAIFSKKISPATKTVVRTTNEEYLDIWHERELDFDLIVSSERETALTVSRLIGVPAARQTDVFADGQVQIVEFDVDGGQSVIGVPLRQAEIPPDSKVASIIRGDSIVVPRGDEMIEQGDRIIVIGSPEAAQGWSKIIAPAGRRVEDVVIYGAGRAGLSTARILGAQGIRVRLVEADLERAREAAEEVPEARVFHATGMDADFIERERINKAQAAVFAMRDDPKNHYAATLLKLHGVPFTIAVVHDAQSAEVFERAGIDRAVNPRVITAEEIVRFAHDPRTQQVAMLEGDRFEILDITVRAESELVDKRFRDLPQTGALIGAIVRDGKALFPHGEDMLQAGDRVIVFTESKRVPIVEKALSSDPSSASTCRRRSTSSARCSSTSASRRSSRPRSPSATTSRRGRSSLRRRSCSERPGASSGSRTARRRSGSERGSSSCPLTWLLAAAVGALPYWLSGEAQFSNPLDAYFEGMSGFTTTGATILTNVEGLSHSLAMWRQLTQWLGGMGIIVLALAVLPRLKVGGRQLLETELPGPRDREADVAHTRDRPAPVAALRRTDRARDRRADRFRLDGARYGDELLRRRRILVHDDPDGRVRDGEPLRRGVRCGLPVGDSLLHARRGRELRAPLSRPRPPTTSGLRPRRGIPPLPRARRARLCRPRRRALGARTSSAARRRSATAPSPPSRR